MPWVYLTIAIIAEIIATSALKTSHGMQRLWPTLLSLAGYCVSFYYLSLVLKALPMGIVYAIWSATGIAAIAIIGWLIYRQPLDLPAIVGLSLIVMGVIVLTAFSGSTIH